MSTTTSPIPPDLFAAALVDLPLPNVYAKAAELQNSITHLLDSNVQMEPFAREGDEVCREAIEENDAVIARMRERIELCREEVVGRGARWVYDHDENAALGEGLREPGEEREGAQGATGMVNGDDGGLVNGDTTREAGERRLIGDEELRRRVEAEMRAMEDENDGDGDGVHL